MLDYGFYGLPLNPFEKNSLLGRQSFVSRDHKRALDAMEAASARNGFAVITAQSLSLTKHMTSSWRPFQSSVSS